MPSGLDKIIWQHLQRLPASLRPRLSPQERVVFIDNPASGGGLYGSYAQYACHLYRMLGYEAELKTTEGPGHAMTLSQQAAKDGATLIIACSGDGGVRESIMGITSIADRNRRPKFSVIPKGTANILAKVMGLQLGPVPDFFHACLKQLYWARTRQIDVGRLNGDAFACFAGFGFDAAVVENVKPEDKKRFKEWAFVASALKTMFGWDSSTRRFRPYEPTPLRVIGIQADGAAVDLEGFFVAVGNVQDYGTNLFPFMRGATLDDGLLDVVVVQTRDVKELLAIGTQVVARTHFDHPKVTFFRTREELIVESLAGAIPVHADSELAPPLKKNIIQIEAGAITVVY